MARLTAGSKAPRDWARAGFSAHFGDDFGADFGTDCGATQTQSRWQIYRKARTRPNC